MLPLLALCFIIAFVWWVINLDSPISIDSTHNKEWETTSQPSNFPTTYKHDRSQDSVAKADLSIDETKLNDDMDSSVKVDYRKLRNLLSVKKYDEANQETAIILSKLIVAGMRAKDVVELKLSDADYTEVIRKNRMDEWDPSNIKTIPRTDILTIDSLWRKYSNDMYGFSIQLDIYSSIKERRFKEVKDFNSQERIEVSQEQFLGKVHMDTMFECLKVFGWSDECSEKVQSKGYYPKFASLSMISFRIFSKLATRLDICLRKD